jgi:hypothetical protein
MAPKLEGRDAIKVTKHIEQLLRQGRKPKELVALGFPKLVVTRVYRRLKKEKAAIEAKTPEGTEQTECHPETAVELTEKIVAIQQRLNSVDKDLQRLGNLMDGLPEMIVLVTAAREFGPYMHDICPHQKDGVCTLWTWPSEGDIPQGIGEALAPDVEKGEWHIKPSPLYCALCPIPFEDRLDDVEGKLLDNPLSGARDITCQGCGTKGMVATSIKCTKCGRETYLGWWPKKE